MQTPLMAVSASLYYQIPKSFLLSPPRRNPNYIFFCSAKPIGSLPPSSSSSILRATNKQSRRDPFIEDSLPFYQFSSPRFKGEQSSESLDKSALPSVEDDSVGISSNMWRVNLKAASGQRINVEGIVCSVSVIVRDGHLALPHISVQDMSHIDWFELKRKGFKGVVFDKDNTLTAPYSLAVWPPFQSSIDRCKAVFGNSIAVFSNSAGLTEYDHDGMKARALEKELGIRVLRHRVKKPAGNAEEVEKHFGCPSSQLIMVGDRLFTDIVYGNRNGFLTVLTKPLSRAEEPFIVRQVRKLEMILLNRWLRRGLKPVDHHLVSDMTQCVKHPSNL